MPAPLPLTALLSVLLLSACVSIPPELLLINRETSVVDDGQRCAVIGYSDTETSAANALDGSGFALLNWNLHRGTEAGLEAQLALLAKGRALLTVQEARLDDDLRSALDALQMHWDFSPGFEFNGRQVGVLTASTAPTLARCARRTSEPWLRIPKVALYTLYPLRDSPLKLLVVNLHGINFSVGTDEFSAQLAQAQHVLDGHPGPIIVAGDFNTWSQARTELLDSLTTGLGMQEVQFEVEHRVRVWGLPLDHIYYRGLRVLDATSSEQPESDHNPLFVRFTLEGEPEP